MNMIFDTDIIDAFRETVEKSKKIIIIGHKNADPDAVGSALALSQFFTNKGIDNQVIIPNTLPDFFGWIRGVENIMIYNENPWDAVTEIQHSDVIFMVDFGEWKRIDDLADPVQVSNALKIVIDHHPNPQSIADFMFVDDSASSAAELVYLFMKIFDKSNIDKQVAEYIFMGLAADTGSFKYDSVTSSTFRIAAELLDFGVDKTRIINGLFNNFSFNRLKLFGYVMSNATFHLAEKRVTYMVLSKQTKEKFNYKKGDHENLVNWAMSVQGTRMAVIFVESSDKVRISLRSTGDFNVSKIAQKFYNGGGHKNASGGDSYLPLDKTIDFFEKNIDEIISVAQM